MRTLLKLLYPILLCVMLTSCTKPVYTSFETSKVKMEKLSAFGYGKCRDTLEELCKNAEQTLKNKGLINYKKKYNNYNIQINQYEITGGEVLTIKNKTDDAIIYTAYNDSYHVVFDISYDEQYLGICDRGKLHVFDFNNNLYELEHYKDKKCTEVYFSLDNKYLLLNNKNQGQIYDFKTGSLVYDNPNNSLTYGYYGEVFYPYLLMDYAIVDNEIILLDEEKRIIIEGGLNSSSYKEEIIRVRKNKEGIDVLIWKLKKAWAPFVSFPPTCSIERLQKF